MSIKPLLNEILSIEIWPQVFCHFYNLHQKPYKIYERNMHIYFKFWIFFMFFEDLLIEKINI